MNYELTDAEDYDSLPDEPDFKFVEIDQICRCDYTEIIKDDTSGDFDTMVCLQYMTTLAAAVAE